MLYKTVLRLDSRISLKFPQIVEHLRLTRLAHPLTVSKWGLTTYNTMLLLHKYQQQRRKRLIMALDLL